MLFWVKFLQLPENNPWQTKTKRMVGGPVPITLRALSQKLIIFISGDVTSKPTLSPLRILVLIHTTDTSFWPGFDQVCNQCCPFLKTLSPSPSPLSASNSKDSSPLSPDPTKRKGQKISENLGFPIKIVCILHVSCCVTPRKGLQ